MDCFVDGKLCVACDPIPSPDGSGSDHWGFGLCCLFLKTQEIVGGGLR
jgi:hypothetical protein